MDKSLERRLDRLERESRVLKRAGAVVLAGLAAAALMGQARSRVEKRPPPPTSVEAERFIVRDPVGKVRAALAVEPDGSTRLVLHDRHGARRAVLAVGADGLPALSLVDADGRSERAALAVESGGAARLLLRDGQGSGGSTRASGPTGGRDSPC